VRCRHRGFAFASCNRNIRNLRPTAAVPCCPTTVLPPTGASRCQDLRTAISSSQTSILVSLRERVRDRLHRASSCSFRPVVLVAASVSFSFRGLESYSSCSFGRPWCRWSRAVLVSVTSCRKVVVSSCRPRRRQHLKTVQERQNMHSRRQLQVPQGRFCEPMWGLGPRWHGM